MIHKRFSFTYLKISYLILILLFFFMSIVFIFKVDLWQFRDPKRILFISSFLDQRSLFVQGGEDNYRPLYLGEVSGSPDWSPDGKYIAVGCENPRMLCIYSANDLPSPRGYPKPIQAELKPEKIIDIPDQCAALMSGNDFKGDVFSDRMLVRSISWSQDNNRLALICESNLEDRPNYVCVVSLDGEEDCWSSSEIKKPVRINWAPGRDELLLSEKSGEQAKIYLLDLKRKSVKPLIDGWSPDWSRNGENIIFLCNMNTYSDPIKYPDICVVQKDGSNKRIIYENPYPNQTDNDNFYYTTFACSETSANCRLSWSSNEKEIVFDGNIGPNMQSSIMKLSIDSNKISVLKGGNINSDPIFEP